MFIEKFDSFFVAAVAKLTEFAEDVFCEIWSLRTKHLYHDGETYGSAVTRVPGGVEEEGLTKVLVSKTDYDSYVDERLQKYQKEDCRIFLRLVEVLLMFTGPNKNQP